MELMLYTMSTMRALHALPSDSALRTVMDELQAGDTSRLQQAVNDQAARLQRSSGGGDDGGGGSAHDDDYGYDPNSQGSATASDASKRAARDKRVAESAFHAQREHTVGGSLHSLLATGKKCDAHGCTRLPVVLCTDCDPRGRRECAEHDRGSHAAIGRVHGARYTLLSLDGFVAPVLHSLGPNQAVRASFAPAATVGCTPVDIEHGVKNRPSHSMQR
jgi:hypothetical protein